MPQIRMTALFQSIRLWAQRLKRDALALWFARKHPDTPLIVKALCWFVVAYALSPIDLIPDFIPVLGYLDDALLLPGLIWLALRILPAHVIDAGRVSADAWLAEHGKRPASYWGAALVVLAWLALLGGGVWLWMG